MTIRTKFILIVVPILIATVCIVGSISVFSTRSGMTRLAVKLMSFKSNELRKYMTNQWELLEKNQFTDKPEFVEAAKISATTYAHTLVRSETELAFALSATGGVEMATAPLTLSPAEQDRLLHAVQPVQNGWTRLTIAGKERIGQTFAFDPFGWQVFFVEESASFFQEVRIMTIRNAIVLIVSVVIAIGLLLIFSRLLTRPLAGVVQAIERIIADNDFSQKVEVTYPDEIGVLANKFNIMSGDLQQAYTHIRDFAFKEALARKSVLQREYETLIVLSKAAEYRDPETAEHIIRVGHYSRMLAQLLGESEEYQNLIFFAAPLHDIGKLGIPDSILIKPGKLTDEEFDIIKTHPAIANEILKEAESPYLVEGSLIALTHHERINGSGYPHGLSGDEIPLSGRIVGLVDIFDAVTSKRPYKDPWPFEKAMDLLREEKEQTLDARLVELFLGNIAEVKRIYAENQPVTEDSKV